MVHKWKQVFRRLKYVKFISLSFYMDMSPSPVFVKQVIATLVVVTKKHSCPDAEQSKIIIHRPSGFHIVAIPGSAVVEGKHHILRCDGYISKKLVGIIKKK